MTDVALPASLSSLLSPTVGDVPLAAAGAVPGGDPFAALLATATTAPNLNMLLGQGATDTAATAGATTPTPVAPATGPAVQNLLPLDVPAVVAPEPPLIGVKPPAIIEGTPITAATTSKPALPDEVLTVRSPQPAILTLPRMPSAVAAPVATPLPAAVSQPIGEDSPADEREDSPKDQGQDPLGDAISSGPTAVLALVPTLTPVPQLSIQPLPQAQAATPEPVRIAIDPPAMLPRRLAPAERGIPLPRPSHPAAPLSDAGPAPLPGGAPQEPSSGTEALPDLAQGEPGRDDNSRGAPSPAFAAKVSEPAIPLLPEAVQAVLTAIKDADQPLAAKTPPAALQPAAALVPGDAAAQAPAVSATVTLPQQVIPRTAAQPAALVAPRPQSRRSEDKGEPHGATDVRKRVDPMADLRPTDPVQRAEPATASQARDAFAAAFPKGDAVVEQTLSIARDGAWLDTLARDIASTAGSGNDLHFKLNPQNLGSLTVAIAQSDDGASIKLTADTHETRNILLDAQPRLMAEARAHGLRVSDTQVDLSNQRQAPNQDSSRWNQGGAGQNATAQNQQNRQSSPSHQPFVSNLGRKAEADPESPASDSDALYA